jgi:hypothetical protein
MRLEKKAVFEIMQILLVLTMLTLAFSIRTVESGFATIIVQK